jgi:hypothetical protein
VGIVPPAISDEDALIKRCSIKTVLSYEACAANVLPLNVLSTNLLQIHNDFIATCAVHKRLRHMARGQISGFWRCVTDGDDRGARNQVTNMVDAAKRLVSVVSPAGGYTCEGVRQVNNTTSHCLIGGPTPAPPHMGSSPGPKTFRIPISVQ